MDLVGQQSSDQPMETTEEKLSSTPILLPSEGTFVSFYIYVQLKRYSATLISKDTHHIYCKYFTNQKTIYYCN